MALISTSLSHTPNTYLAVSTHFLLKHQKWQVKTKLLVGTQTLTVTVSAVCSIATNINKDLLIREEGLMLCLTEAQTDTQQKVSKVHGSSLHLQSWGPHSQSMVF